LHVELSGIILVDLGECRCFLRLTVFKFIQLLLVLNYGSARHLELTQVKPNLVVKLAVTIWFYSSLVL
jgi:hypothetical protein